MVSLTDRQRQICLLLSVGQAAKSIARLLDIGVRTVELEKQQIAASLKIPTRQLTIWAVENRTDLFEAIKDKKAVPKSILDLIGST
jgi:DNA-binding NarL/FixJ family response regulator